MPLHISSTRAYRQEVKIVLYSLWYHHTYRWSSRVIKINILTLWSRIFFLISPHPVYKM